jgi:flagellar biosynthesis chaperone FliJ
MNKETREVIEKRLEEMKRGLGVLQGQWQQAQKQLGDISKAIEQQIGGIRAFEKLLQEVNQEKE